MKNTAPIAENSLLSLLAVNNWSLERVYGLREALMETGLTDFEATVTLSQEEIAKRLAAAGYNRGTFLNSLMALRILSLAQALSNDQLVRLSEFIQNGQDDAVSATLQKIKGVGPAVLRNFWILQSAQNR